MKELRAKVYGRVHGVGFRSTTVVLAHELGVKGTVRNCADGTVEIIAQGKNSEKLLAKLRETFENNIDRIEAELAESEKFFSEFRVA